VKNQTNFAEREMKNRTDFTKLKEAVVLVGWQSSAFFTAGMATFAGGVAVRPI